jgi:neutral ceramidase
MIRTILVALLVYATLPSTAVGAQKFTAGAAAIDVTPTNMPVRVAGSIRETWKSEITDKLHVRCLLLNDGRNSAVIATVDTCIMGREMLDAAKAKASRETGIPTANMLISATHAHSAPAVRGAHGTEPHLEYREYLTAGIARAIVAAYRNQRPAEIGWGVGKCDEYVFCRRWLMKPGKAFSIPFTDAKTNLAQMNPGNGNVNKIRATGPADPDVTVLMVRGVDGRPISLLANYSTHYAGAPGVSADYFGVFADEVMKRLGAENQDPPFVGLISNGASGDANCTDVTSKVRNKYDRFIVAEAVAGAAMSAVKRIEYHKWVPVRPAESEMALKIRKPTATETREAKAYLAEHVKDRPVQSWTENYARETVLLSEWPDRFRFKVQAFRIGDFAFAATPCEMYGSTGLRIKKASPFKTTMVVGLANGYSGYLPPPDQFELGGYTTWRARSSMLEKQAEPKIRNELQRLLKQTAARK